MSELPGAKKRYIRAGGILYRETSMVTPQGDHWEVRSPALDMDGCIVLPEPKRARSYRGLLTSPDDGVREAAVLHLAEIPGRESRQMLIRATRDRAPGVRAASATALGREGSPAALKRLLAMAGDAAEAVDVRSAAILALRDRADRQARTVLRKILSDSQQPMRLRIDAASTLSTAGALDAHAFLLRNVNHSREGDSCLQALADCGDARAIPPLRKRYTDAGPGGARLRIAKVLHRLGVDLRLEAAAEVLSGEALPAISRGEGLLACDLLREVGSEDAARVLEDAARRGADEEVVIRATMHLRGLGRGGGERAPEILKGWLSSPDPDHRVLAVRSMDAVEPDAAVAMLVALLGRETDGLVKELAGERLFTLASRIGKDHLAQGRWARALEAFGRAVRIRRAPEILLLVGYLEFRTGDPAAARGTFRAVVKASPRFRLGWYNLGCVNAAQGKRQAARRAFRRYLRHSASDRPERIESARAYLRRNPWWAAWLRGRGRRWKPPPIGDPSSAAARGGRAARLRRT